MQIAYLGLFQRVFEWVMANILDPVYRFVSNLLTTVFTWIFQEILAPILMPILQETLNFLIDLWLKLYSTQLYLLFSGVLKLIDYLQTAFDVFIGLEDVTYTEANGQVITGSLVEVLMQQKTVSTVFWMITLGALGIALMLTIYATAKSAFDLDFENKRPVSKVLTAMMKTFIQFFTVPFLVYFLLKLAAVILRGVVSAFGASGSTSLGRIVFTIASLDAAKESAYNLSTATGNITLGTSPEDIIRYPFYSMGGDGVATRDYGDIKAVTEYFDLSSFDYLIGFIAAIFLLFTIGVCLIVFVQRIFEIILLYLVSPYFVCMIPLDDGEKFGRWREMFIGKCFTGFGSAIGMRLFLMICPLVMGNQIRFGTAISPEMDYMMKLFFLAGGAWAVNKSGSMITSLLSSQAGSTEANTAAMAGGMLYAYTAGAAMSKGRQAIGSALQSRGKGKGADAEAGEGKGGKGGKGGSPFDDLQPDPVKQKYTGAKGWAARHFMGSQFVNNRVRGVMGKAKSATIKLAKAERKLGKAAGYTSSITGWMSGRNKTPEERNRFQRAAAKVSEKTEKMKEQTRTDIKGLHAFVKEAEEIEKATHTRWGLLSMEFDKPDNDGQKFEATEKPQKLDIQIGRHRALNKDSTVGVDGKGNLSSWQFATPETRRANGAYYRPTYRMASGSGSTVKKASGTVAGSQAKYSDVSIKGRNVSNVSRRYTISSGTTGYDQSSSGSSAGSSGGSAVTRHTISGGVSGYERGGSSGSSSGQVTRHTISGGVSGSGQGGSSGSGVRTPAGRSSVSGGVNVRLDRRERK